MAEAQNKKKGAAKGQKVKKGSPAKRSFFFRPATIILALLTTLLLVLGIVYLARVQQWFSPSLAEQKVQKSPVTVAPVEEKKMPVEEQASLPAEEYHQVPPARRVGQEPLLRDQGPFVAIIIDDLGADLAMMQDLLDLQLNFTAAVLPNVPHARAAAELAHADGREVLLHVPMEPRDYPVVDPGEQALMVDLSRAEVQDRLRNYLRIVPWVVGANNHMGSRFTESREGMRGVLQILKEQGLFFVDSRTSAASVAIDEAEGMGIAHAERDLFLDNDINEEAIRRQIRKLIGIAKEQGSAIGICHPHLETCAALKKEAPSFAAAGVKLVAVSALLH
jgi:polysaccharide deacetylase 2 family uncharacterized protein YibQ